jgi:hypothetical protein
MLAAGQEFSEEIIERIRRRVGEDVSLTRTGLSREVCEWLNWRRKDGRVKDMNCRVAILRLERRGVIKLPEARVVSFRRRGNQESEPSMLWPRVEKTLGEVGKVWLEPVESEDAKLSREWWAMMQAHHPLGGGPLCGAQMRYLVRSEEGYLGGLSFSAAAWRLGARDQWIGWDEERRKAGLEKKQPISNPSNSKGAQSGIARLESGSIAAGGRLGAALWYKARVGGNVCRPITV